MPDIEAPPASQAVSRPVGLAAQVRVRSLLSPPLRWRRPPPRPPLDSVYICVPSRTRSQVVSEPDPIDSLWKVGPPHSATQSLFP